MHLFVLYAIIEANAPDMNECDAPESNNIVAGIELTRRVPITVALFLSFININVVSMTTSVRRRSSVIVGGPIVAMVISVASRVNYQLILSLGAVFGNMAWLKALEA